MAKKIYLSPSSQSENAYATGGTNEQTQCRKIAEACGVFLKKVGFEVKVGNSGTMQTRTADSNGWGADLHVPIHTNATENHNVTGGTSILLYSLSGERLEAGQAIFKRLSPITPGKSAERLMAYPGFYEIKNARAITVYCECEFHDTKTGSDFIIKNTKQIGEAIAKGICDYYGVKIPDNKQPETENKTPSNDDTMYIVKAGAFKARVNADERVRELEKAGFEAYVSVEVKK
jgi:N-acetylmuramoyl-L-alanine amidase